MLQLFEPVALLNPRPELGLSRGQVGAVVEVYDDGAAFEVEFSNDRGETYALGAFKVAELLRLVHESKTVA
jgi:hypothetical protein